MVIPSETFDRSHWDLHHVDFSTASLDWVASWLGGRCHHATRSCGIWILLVPFPAHIDSKVDPWKLWEPNEPWASPAGIGAQ